MPKFNIVDAKTGGPQEIDVDILDYKAAGDQSLSLTQHLQNKFDADPKYGTVLEQCMASAGMILRADPKTGLTPPSMKSIMDGTLDVNLGTINRNDGANNHTPSGRLLFPEVIMQLIQAELTTSNDDFLGGYDQMVATTAFVNSPKVDQPTIDVTAPEASASQPIAQLAEPAKMVTITVNEKAWRIPTRSIGLTISDEAMAATALDLVGLAMTSQARGERVRMVEGQLAAMMAGDADVGESDLTSQTVTSASFDSASTTLANFSHTAWVKFLRAQYRKMTVTDIMCDIDMALAIENRTGKPTVTTDDPNSPRIDALFSLKNLGIVAPRILLVETAVVGAGRRRSRPPVRHPPYRQRGSLLQRHRAVCDAPGHLVPHRRWRDRSQAVRRCLDQDDRHLVRTPRLALRSRQTGAWSAPVFYLTEEN